MTTPRGEHRACALCGGAFYASPSRLKQYPCLYCSSACSRAARRTRITRICPVCGKAYEVWPSDLKAGVRLRCSLACRGAARRGISTAPDVRAAVVRMSVDEGLTSHEIAERLGILASSVWRHLKQADMPTRRPAAMVESVCRTCGRTFSVSAAEQARRPRMFCGRACSAASITALADRFWRFVQKTDGCWLWTGSKSKAGYGRLSGGKRGATPLIASRVSWLLHFGPIPDGKMILHVCDTPACVRPNHLFPGTAEMNAKDMARKGRHWKQRRPPSPLKHPLAFVP